RQRRSLARVRRSLFGRARRRSLRRVTRGRLEIREQLSEPGSGGINEDVVGWCDCAAWVIDGATRLGFQRLTDDESDARWSSRRLGEAFAGHAGQAVPLVEVLRRAIVDTGRALVALSGSEPEPMLAPSSCAALVRVCGDRLEYAVLGDCTVMVEAA